MISDRRDSRSHSQREASIRDLSLRETRVGSNVQPLSQMRQCVLETEIALSGAFSSHILNVRVHRGEANERKDGSTQTQRRSRVSRLILATLPADPIAITPFPTDEPATSALRVVPMVFPLHRSVRRSRWYSLIFSLLIQHRTAASVFYGRCRRR